ncbi:MAG TPA: polysaccharide deacetylase family protein [Acidimicrobiales bacterium]|nr:polysaccharide deacetylase family protein [Acidimicrobiales bacterium]
MAPHDRRLGRRAGAWAAGAAGAATFAHFLPSVCVLGQWSPVRLRALPGGWCRWWGPPGSAHVALTFDDGPSPDTTPRTLDLLDDLGMRATFFVLGSQAEYHPELVAELRRRGHGVGSHGYRHEHHLLRTPGWIRQDMAAAVAAIEATGERPRWYRPAYGQLTARTVLEARRHDMEVVLWSVWGHEWSETDPEPVMARLSPGLQPGAIVLLHDNDVSCPPGTAAVTHRSLELLAGALADRGLQAVDLDTLFEVAPAAEPVSW